MACLTLCQNNLLVFLIKFPSRLGDFSLIDPSSFPPQSPIGLRSFFTKTKMTSPAASSNSLFPVLWPCWGYQRHLYTSPCRRLFPPISAPSLFKPSAGLYSPPWAHPHPSSSLPPALQLWCRNIITTLVLASYSPFFNYQHGLPFCLMLLNPSGTIAR